MDLVPILATVALLATGSTLVLAMLAFRALRVREGHRAADTPAPDAARKVFLVRLHLPDAHAPKSPRPTPEG